MPELEEEKDLSHLLGFLPQRELALLEMFREAERKVAENAADENTTAKAKREVTLKVTYDFSETRALNDATLASTTKLAAKRPFKIKELYLDEGQRQFVEINPAQPSLPMGEKVSA